MEKRRIEAVDYLRGCMALAIMLYHFVTWSSGLPDGNTVLGRLGVYGVSIFYILSGMSLYVAYSNASWNKGEMIIFWKRRLLRIAPVYWLACLGVLVLLKGYKSHSIEAILVNLTLTFSFLDYTNYIPTGGWSIGNEICFYLIFPALIISTKNKYLFSTLCLALFTAYVYFAFYSLRKDTAFSPQWKTYIHPLNQAFLFAGGIMLAKISTHARHSRPSNKISFALLASSAAGLFLYGNTPTGIDLVTSENRMIFTAFSLVACYACFNMNMSGKTLIERPLKRLGEISYSIYMLHAVLYTLMQSHLHKVFLKQLTPLQFSLIIVVPVVLLAATYCYRNIELPFIRFGKITSGSLKDRLRISFARPPARLE